MRIVHGWAYPDADEFMAREMTADGTYQADHLDAALEYVSDWREALDGGAHVGTWSRLLSQRFLSVVAVEPSLDTFEALELNMVTFSCANVRTLNVALGAATGIVAMGLDPAEVARKNTGGRFVEAVGTGVGIPVVTIDSLALQALSFLKLDIEGSEPLALLGARATLDRCRPIVLYENKGLWKRYGMKPNAVSQILEKARYKLLRVVGGDAIWGPA